MGAARKGMRRLLVNLFGLACVFSCGYMTWTVFSGRSPWFPTVLLQQNPVKLEYQAEGQVCQRPPLDVSNYLVEKYIKKLPRLKCSSEKDWLFLSQGSVWADQTAINRHGAFTCTLDMHKRVDDYTSVVRESITFSSSEKKAALTADFFEVRCKAKDGSEWSDIMAGIHKSPADPQPGSKGSTEEPKWNVLMFGFDSTSRLHFMRKMPKTYKFLTSEMDAVILEGYNIVGDGTPQALIPILTGFAEPELPDTRKRLPNTAYVNVYPWVWNNFSDRGYVTAFAEDTPNVGIFTYRLNGFKEQPTDHYMRAFYVEAEKQFSKHERLCLGSLTRHQVMLDWFRQFYEVYRDQPKFAFGFHGEISHDDFNLISVADDDVVEFCRGLRDNGLLSNTFLIIMSDHGHRFSPMRAMAQGKLEERLPFFSISMPPAFKSRHAQLAANLRENAQRVTSPYDLYTTFLSLLDPTGVPPVANLKKRSVSLFSKIPEERTCAQAGIEPHWCTCLSWESVSPEEPVTKEAAQSVVDFINQYTSGQAAKCARLTLKQVKRAERHQPSQAVLSYKGVLDKDGFVPDLTDTAQAQVIIYSVQFEVHPSGGIYEASVNFNTKQNTFHVDPKDISRVNMYGSQPHCVQEEFPHLMKYCYCKVQLKT